MVIRVLREVKRREDEYTFVKDLMLRIRGFPDMIQLLNRERRLIAHGALRRVYLSEQSKKRLEGLATPASNKQRRLKRDLNKESLTNTRHRRANSLDSCLSDASSVGSVASAVTSTLLGHSEHGSHSLRAKQEWPQKSHETSKTTNIYAYIFTDLAVFTVPSNMRSRERDGKEWEFIPDIGVCRILFLRDYSGKLGTAT